MGLHKAEQGRNRRRVWVATATVAGLAMLLQVGGDSLRDALAYTRTGIAAGQLWRLVTGHLVHLGWSHLFWDLAGLAIVSYLTGNAFDLRRWAYVAMVSIAAIDAGFWFLYPELDWYVGLSGLIHGLLAAGLYAGVMRRDHESMVLAPLLLAKIAWEQFVGPMPGSEGTSGGPVIVDAHFYGVLGGLLAAAILRHRVRYTASL